MSDFQDFSGFRVIGNALSLDAANMLVVSMFSDPVFRPVAFGMAQLPGFLEDNRYFGKSLVAGVFFTSVFVMGF